ncbi:MAG: hypothetical protein V1887_01375 [Candidatus Aenigmatarchaeota archaeon]
MHLFHGTTQKHWESIRKEGLRPQTTLTDSLYLPLSHACVKAAAERDDAVILLVDTDDVSGFEQCSSCFPLFGKPGACYINPDMLPACQLTMVDRIPHKMAERFASDFSMEYAKLAYRQRLISLGHEGLSAYV